jgi:hypothetical protein
MALMAESGCLEQVDRGADNPTSYYTNYHETRKGGQGPVFAVAPLIIIRTCTYKVQYLPVEWLWPKATG